MSVEERLMCFLTDERMKKFEESAEPSAVAYEAYLKLKESPVRPKVSYTYFNKIYNRTLSIYNDNKRKKVFRHDDVVKSLKDAYELMLQNKPVDYKGPLLETSAILGTCFNIDETLKRYKNAKKEQGRTPLDLILSCAFQLGIQQGIYMCVEKPSTLGLETDEEKLKFKRDVESHLMTEKEVEEMFERLESFKEKLSEIKTKSQSEIKMIILDFLEK